jgi:transcriptional regulator with XRE-family HTH domain
MKMILRRLKDIREEYDLSQNELANILGITQQNYSYWETEEKIIPIEHLNNFCNYFKVSMDYVMDLSNIRCYKDYNENINKVVVGNRLKEIRDAKNLTQEKLADLLNTSHSTLSSYENSKTMLLTAFAYQIATTYNISVDWLYGKTK